MLDIIENTLWIFWKHLDYYFNYSPFLPEKQKPISALELNQLRKDVNTALNRQVHPGRPEPVLNALTQIEKVLNA